MILSFFYKNAFFPLKRAKRSKSGRLEKINFFVYCSKLARLIFFLFCIKLEGIKGYKLPQTPFFRKKSNFLKNGEKGPKWPKNRVFGLLCKIESLVFARNDLKRSVLWLADFMHKCHIWENSYSRDLYAKALDQSDRSIFQITISFEPFYHFLYIFCIYRKNAIKRLR